MRQLAEDLAGLSRSRKLVLMVAYDAAAMLVALWLAFSARYGEFYWPDDERILVLCLSAVALGAAALLALRIYRGVIRYLHHRMAGTLLAGAAAAAGIWVALAYFSRLQDVPRSVGLIYFIALYLLMFFGRVAAYEFLTGFGPRISHPSRRAADQPIGVAIYGANEVGNSLAESIARNSNYNLRVFIDDNPALIGRRMAGYPIRPSSDLQKAVKAGAVQQVLLAMPEATRSERLAMVKLLSSTSVRVMTIPSFEEIASGRFTLSDIRPVKVDDLLKRDIVPAQAKVIEESLRGRSVLVTGAGGSIGSEICRQVARNNPARLVLLDHSEFALYSIDSELRRTIPGVEFVPIIGSVLDSKLLRAVLRDQGIGTVFHAAAYKHVPLLEDHAIAAVANNIFGTVALADACLAEGVAKMTMISTDKAVRPANVMGTTKRAAELYIQALAADPEVRTQFGIVRFGNVLDSSGSVVQRFRRQVAEGGPVTVTHREITRFFMSIPEATHLVLQASTLARKGEVFVLDMGEPVLITDLARTMISLAGLSERTPENPAGDIEIVYTGLRPGEKLYEELFVGDVIEPTSHPQIRMAREPGVPREVLERRLAALQRAVTAFDDAETRRLLFTLLQTDQGHGLSGEAAERRAAQGR